MSFTVADKPERVLSQSNKKNHGVNQNNNQGMLSNQPEAFFKVKKGNECKKYDFDDRRLVFHRLRV